MVYLRFLFQYVHNNDCLKQNTNAYGAIVSLSYIQILNSMVGSEEFAEQMWQYVVDYCDKLIFQKWYILLNYQLIGALSEGRNV